ncbi:MAG TPA: hypothetical protein VEF04_03500 [Blastocatellia bacterium]|nr:hypothetical protein [Blastocatellia bacterium]
MPIVDFASVEALITVDNNNQVRVTPDPIILSVDDGEEVNWMFDQQLLAINFSPNSTPFEGATYVAGEGGACLSGPPMPGTEGTSNGGAVSSRSYKYTVQVTTGQGEFITHDPRVIIIRRRPKGTHL